MAAFGAPRRPNPKGAWGLRAHPAVLVVGDGNPSTPPRVLAAPRKPQARGVTVALLRAAARHARALGGTTLEGYPVEPKSAREIPPVFAFTGVASAFRKAGFREVARRSPTRPIMRVDLRR